MITDSNTKLISLIMPTYNVESYIVDSIHSILNQNSQNYQLIIVDDHSLDQTVEIIKKFFIDEIEKGIITLIELKHNSGPSVARQIGLDMVETPYVTFIDSDDSYISTNVISLLEKNIHEFEPDLIMYKYQTDHGRIKIKKKYKLPANRLLTRKEAFVEKITSFHPIWHYIWNKCYRTEIIKSHNIHFIKELRIAEDVRFNEDFLQYCNRLLFIDQYLYLYNCMNSQSISKHSSNRNEKTIEDFKKRFNHEFHQFDRLSYQAKLFNCEKECERALQRQLCLSIINLFNQAKPYPFYKDIKKQIQETVYYSIINPVYFECYIRQSVKSFFSTLKRIIKKQI